MHYSKLSAYYMPLEEINITEFLTQRGLFHYFLFLFLQYLSERAQNLPVLGGWMGEKCTANLEEIAKLSPDIIVFMTDLETDNMEYATKNAQSITDQTKRPVVVLDSLFTETVEAYRMMGDFIGAQERAEQLASYSEQKMKEVSDMVAKIPEDRGIFRRSCAY